MRHVLVVEDDPMVSKVLWSMLVSRYKVTVAVSVEEAMEQLDTFEFDAVVADVELGSPFRDRDGSWLLHQAANKSPRARRLLISGHHQDLDEKGMDTAVDATLSKPFTREALFQALEV